MRLPVFLSGAALLCVSAASRADSMTQNFTANGSATGAGTVYIDSTSFSEFNPSLGTLNSITIDLSGSASTTALGEPSSQVPVLQITQLRASSPGAGQLETVDLSLSRRTERIPSPPTFCFLREPDHKHSRWSSVVLAMAQPPPPPLPEQSPTTTLRLSPPHPSRRALPCSVLDCSPSLVC